MVVLSLVHLVQVRTLYLDFKHSHLQENAVIGLASLMASRQAVGYRTHISLDGICRSPGAGTRDRQGTTDLNEHTAQRFMPAAMLPRCRLTLTPSDDPDQRAVSQLPADGFVDKLRRSSDSF